MTRKPKEAPAPKERIVKVADWAAERGDAVIVTLGLGSCVAIMLHDANAGAGAMAHILLPSKSLARDVTNLAKFPETAVPLLVEQLTALMLAQLMTPGSVQMGERNVAAARDVLRRIGIPVMREAVGGGAGRSVRFYVADGRVEIRSVGVDAIVL